MEAVIWQPICVSHQGGSGKVARRGCGEPIGSNGWCETERGLAVPRKPDFPTASAIVE
jgi:hypothetical protein